MGLTTSAPFRTPRTVPREGGSRGRHANRDNQPRTLTLDNHHIQYRHNPNGPIIFYIDRQPLEPPASEVQQTEKLMNYANLLKASLALSPSARPAKFHLSFTVDSLVDVDCAVYFGVEERWDEIQGLHYLPRDLSRCSVQHAALPAEAGHRHTCPGVLDVDQPPACLCYDEANPFFFPIVIALQYRVPQVNAAADDPNCRRWQFTYCEVLPAGAGYQVRVIRQRLQLADWSAYDLEDVYGGMGHAGHSSGEAEVRALYGDVGADGEECVICLVNDRDTTVMPCRHMCLCGDCADALRRQTNKCPICRGVVDCLVTIKKDDAAA